MQPTTTDAQMQIDSLNSSIKEYKAYIMDQQRLGNPCNVERAKLDNLYLQLKEQKAKI